jgi:hypothetical protein
MAALQQDPAGGQPAPIFYVDSDEAETIRMIELLQRGGAYRYMWAKYPQAQADGRIKRTRWQATTDDVRLPAGDADYYWGVHPCAVIPQTDSEGKPAQPQDVRGRNEIIAAANCFYAEWDVKPKAGQTQTDAFCDALDMIAALRYPPTTLICSGGGYHAYWIFPQPFIIRSEDERQTLRKLQAAFVNMVGSDGGAKDIARVLRVPGTFNLKPGRNRYVVRFVHPVIDDRFYSFDMMRGWIESGQAGQADVIMPAVNADVTGDLDAVQIGATVTTTNDPAVVVNIPQAVPQPARVIEAQPAQAGAMSDADLIAKIKESKQAAKFDALMAGSITGYASQSEADEGLCTMLAWWTKDAAQIKRVWSQSKLADRDKFDREDYQTRTIAAAVSKIGADGYRPPAQPAQGGRPQARQATRSIGDTAAQIRQARAARQAVQNG